MAEIRPEPSVNGRASNTAPKGRGAEIPFGGDQTGSLGGSSRIRLVGTNEHIAAEAAERALGLMPQLLESLLRGLGLRETETFGLGSERMREVRGRKRLSGEDGSRR